MNVAVKHITEYSYSIPATLGMHVFRLRPRYDGTLLLLDYKLKIDPAPTLITDCLDLEGNLVTHAWFQGVTDRLKVTSRFTVETVRANPFDYVLDDRVKSLPLAYPNDIAPALTCYCARENNAAVLDFASGIARTVDWHTADFLTGLNNAIHGMTEKVIRETGAPQPAEVTLREQSGSCRDLAVLFIEAARAFGLAARFVSGYQKGSEEFIHRYMHAWAEVYLPGGGWRAYDPTQGLAVADAHVALAASRDPIGATPISGGFGGAGVSSSMQVQLEIT